MQPSAGRIVNYQLSVHDVPRIDTDRRADPYREGNFPCIGDIVPLLVVRAWPHEYDTAFKVGMAAADEDGVQRVHQPASHWGVNGQAFLDGNDTLWVCSAPEGDWPGSWSWPPR